MDNMAIRRNVLRIMRWKIMAGDARASFKRHVSVCCSDEIRDYPPTSLSCHSSTDLSTTLVGC